ncbi:MAG: hypothetical protein Q3X94_07555 [Oscillospiraceae bacterium]|nr:hypothetical protein [Oscillospiraceae bacterium]
MKLPEPKQLPSGKWHVQIMVQGRRMGKTFRTKEEASYWAAGIKTRCREAEKSPRDMTVGELLDRYIMSKDSVLSPSTIAGYKQIRKGWSQSFVRLPLADLTQEKVQREINAMAKTKSPKSVRNARGLLSAALAEFWRTLPCRKSSATRPPYHPLRISCAWPALLRASPSSCRCCWRRGWGSGSRRSAA